MQTRMKAAAPITEIFRVVMEVSRASTEAEICRGTVAALADDVGVRGDEPNSCGWKFILPNTQSINGL